LPRFLSVNLAVKANAGIASWGQLVKRQYPLKVKGTERKTHVQGVIHTQILKEYGASFEDIETWGGKLHIGPDGYIPEFDTAERMIDAINDGTLDGLFTSKGAELAKIHRAIPLTFLTIEDNISEILKQKYGHRIIRVLPDTLFPGQNQEFTTVLIGGLLLYTREEVSEVFVKTLAKVIHENSLELASCQDGVVGLPGIDLSNTWVFLFMKEQRIITDRWVGYLNPCLYLYQGMNNGSERPVLHRLRTRTRDNLPSLLRPSNRVHNRISATH